MNAVRRKSIKRIMALIEEMDALKEQIQEELEAVLDEEQEAFDNMPESLQESERGERIQECIEYLETAVETFAEFYSEEAIEALEEAIA